MPTQKILLVSLTGLCLVAQGQGTFLYDQQSIASDTQGAVSFNYVQPQQPMGQSFSPALSEVGFVRLFVRNAAEMPLAATIHVNLLANSIPGAVLGQSYPVVLPGGRITANPIDFFFPASVPVTPGLTYYFQPVVEDNANVAVASGSYAYSGGAAFISGVPSNAEDLWFREGVYVVPEPSPVWLLLIGSMVFGFRAQRREVRTLSVR